MGCNNNNHPLIDSSTTIRGCNNSCVPKNVNIVCKEIIIPEGQEIISVKGEKNANTRIFLIPKTTSNGDDLSDKTFTILTEDSKGYQTSTLIAEKEIINNYIKIKWIIDETATITEGDLLVAIQASGDDFLWSTLPARFTVADTIEVVEEGEIVIPSVVTKLQREVLQLQNSLYGGETNTVLTKKSNDNLDFQWKTVTIPDISAIYARIQEVENEIPSKTSELINDSEFVNSSSLDISVQKNISISSIGDNVSLNETKVNLKTKVESATTEQIPLATSTHAGMMSSSDYSTLSSLTSRVQSLEGKTTRILYTSSVTKEDISIVSTTLLTAGSRLAAGSIISGKIVSEVVEIDEDAALDIGDVIKTGSILANASVVNDISYPTAQDIEEFIVSLGYEEPFEGIAVVTINTYHIWHYYVNGGIGWRDDGVDTASNFTNETVGLIKGSESAGKVYAETDGTGSINGWDNLNNQVENTKNKVENLENISLYSTTEKVVGTWIDGNPIYRRCYIKKGISATGTIVVGTIPSNMKLIKTDGIFYNTDNSGFYSIQGDYAQISCLNGNVNVQFYSAWGNGDITLILEYTKPILPYAELTHIESTGTQYIDTEIIGDGNKSIELVYTTLDSFVDGNTFGSWSSSNCIMSGFNRTNNAWETYYNTTGGLSSASGKYTNTQFTLSISNTSIKFKRGDTLVINKTLSSSSFSTNATMHIFARHIKRGTEDYAQGLMAMKFNSCKIWDSGNLVRDLIPVIRNSDSKVCLYDKVTETFFENAGTGDFIAGDIK